MESPPDPNRVACQQCGRLAFCEFTANVDGSFDDRLVCRECRERNMLRTELDKLKARARLDQS